MPWRCVPRSTRGAAQVNLRGQGRLGPRRRAVVRELQHLPAHQGLAAAFKAGLAGVILGVSAMYVVTFLSNVVAGTRAPDA